MEAEDILTATHELEETGMTRSQSEAIAKTIIAAVEPLATKADLEATKADIAALREETKAEFADLRKEFKAGFVDLREETRADFAVLREEYRAGFAVLREDNKAGLDSMKEYLATKQEVESVKVWLMTGLLGLTASLLAVAAGIAFT